MSDLPPGLIILASGLAAWVAVILLGSGLAALVRVVAGAM